MSKATNGFIKTWKEFGVAVWQWTKQYAWLLLIIWLLALTIKVCYFTTHQNFSQDQVRDVLLIKSHIESRNFLISTGPSTSVGNFSLPPLYYYLQLFAQSALGNTFYAMDYLIILLESLTPLLLFYLIQKSTQNKSAALIGSLLYAFSPLVIITSTSAWNPNLIPLVALLFISSGLSFVLDRSLPSLSIAIVSFAVVVNLHFQWFVLLPLLLFLLFVALRNFRTTWAFLGGALLLSAVLFLPYLYTEVANNFVNLRAALTYFSSNQLVFERIRKPAYVLFFFPSYFARVLSGTTFGPDWKGIYEAFDNSRTFFYGSALVFFPILAANIWLAVVNSKQKRNWWLASLLLVFFSMSISLRLFKGDKPDYFLNTFLFFIFVFLGSLLSLLHKKVVLILAATPLLLLELWTVWHIPPHHGKRDFDLLSANIQQTFPNRNQYLLLPLHQELEYPISYYLKPNQPEDTQTQLQLPIIAVCFSWQNCQGEFERLLTALSSKTQDTSDNPSVPEQLQPQLQVSTLFSSETVSAVLIKRVTANE